MSARVLVVDDILPNVKLLEAKLASEYYDVVTATSGKEALAKVESDSPDIVLLDVMMPEMDGFEVCKTIKENPAHAHIPVVMVTALTDATDRVRGLEAGADDFLSKPLNDTALMARVRSLVRLKMTVDEWRVRENTATQLGVSEEAITAMHESYENANILVVEDQAYDSDKFVDILKVDNDTVEVVKNGADAMTKATVNQYDLLVISLNLDNEDGLRLCSHLRSGERTRSIPILMVAADEDMSRVAHGLEIGAHDYILRPVDKNELLARVRTQVRRRRFQERLRSSYEVNLSMALTDSLTGLYNRRYFDVHLQKMLQKNKDSRKSLGILMLDIDHFKSVNDTYGHAVGDEVLKEFASRIQNRLRGFDMVARMGGEEFVVLLPDISQDKAFYVAERLRSAIEKKPFKCNVPEGELSITTSIGGVLAESDTEEDGALLLKHADECLYEAKENGRNATYFYDFGKINPEKFVEAPRLFVKD